MQMNIYVYDLDVSKTQYVLAFRTGVPDAKHDTGAGSGSAPSGISALGEPISTGMGIGSGLKLERYPYFDPATGGVNFSAVMGALEKLPARSVVLLHASCHNPTGADLSEEQKQ